MSTDRPDDAIPGTATTPTAPPTPAGGPPVASPPPDPGAADQVEAGGTRTKGHAEDADRDVEGEARDRTGA